jgi:alkanesulfonate monooxygenase SsuD/methylene tetrahydromethanopterin reductase-like flavin-dependent oxidoreductase (luciferase family)
MSWRERQPVTALALRDPYPWPDLAELARWVEDAGFAALFLPEVGARDTLATLAALAGETRTMRLATGVVPLPARSPSLLAMAAATVQERSGGRLLLGLGTGPSVPGALNRLRSVVVALREAFAGKTGYIESGVAVSTELPLTTPPEIWIAALGPRATRLAGEIADGVLLNWCTPARVRAARAEVSEGAAAAGRGADAITVAVYVRAALVEGARTAAEAMAAEYTAYPAYRRQFETMGIDSADPAAITRAVMLLDPGTATEELDAYRSAGADLPVVYPVLPEGPADQEAARSTLMAVAPNLL